MIHVFTGIDPGLIHTGLVNFVLDSEKKQWRITSHVVLGLNVNECVELCKVLAQDGPVFIEAYRPRSHFQQDENMAVAVRALRQRIPNSKVIQNTGATKVVKQSFMKMLSVWKFSETTHHQDLRAAARIGLYGALKDAQLNDALASFLSDNLSNQPWARVDTATL